MLGGILIETSDVEVSDDDYIKTTSILKWWIFEYEYPFLLPCLCGAVIAALALSSAILFIHNEKIKYHELDDNHSQSTYVDINDIIDIDHDSITSKMEMTTTKSEPFQIDNKICYDPAHHNSLPTPDEFTAMGRKFETDQLKLLGNNVKNMETDDFITSFRNYQIKTAKDMFKRTLLPHCLLQYAMAAISHMMFKEMGPVYMAQALLFNSEYIGYTQAFGGGILFFFTLFMQPWLLKKYNHRLLCMWFGALGSVICVYWMPSIYWFTFAKNIFLSQKLFLLLLACLCEGVFTGTFSVCFVVSACYVNNSVPNTHIGKANGVGQTVAAFVRGVGPMYVIFTVL